MTNTTIKTNTTEKKDTFYKGNYSSYQTKSNHSENKSLTLHQKQLYEKTVFGLKAISKEQLTGLDEEDCLIIKYTHLKCQEILNIWKQEITNDISNQLFKKYFPKSPFTKTLTEKYPNIVDKNVVNTIPFKLLGINRNDIIQKLMNCGILPKDFYDIKSKYSNLKL